MKFIIPLLFFISIAFGSNATIEVIKKADSLPSLAIEDSSEDFDNLFKNKFFKMLAADMNVLSLFNVERSRRIVTYNSDNVAVENKDKDYVLRYKLIKNDSGALQVAVKLIGMNQELFSKSYKVNNKDIYMFVAHSIAYDINDYMGEPSVEWMKRKVIFSRIIAPRKSEIVVADYTLSYQHTIIKGGFNIFPKWADK